MGCEQSRLNLKPKKPFGQLTNTTGKLSKIQV